MDFKNGSFSGSTSSGGVVILIVMNGAITGSNKLMTISTDTIHLDFKNCWWM